MLLGICINRHHDKLKDKCFEYSLRNIEI